MQTSGKVALRQMKINQSIKFSDLTNLCQQMDTIFGHNISNNHSFRLKHPGIPDGFDGSDGPSYLLTPN